VSGLPWFKCYPRDFNEGMMGLTLEERGAYITILNLIYARGAPIPEDTWWITSQLGCSARAWTKVRASLVVKRKLYEVEVDGQPHLMNRRAAEEIDCRTETSQKFATAGARGGRNSKAKARESNDLGQAKLDEGLSLDKAIQIQTTDIDSAEPKGSTERQGAQPDYDRIAWDQAVIVLTAEGMTEKSARAFFGKLLRDHKLPARALTTATMQAGLNGTHDPQSYLTKAAQGISKRAADAHPDRPANAPKGWTPEWVAKSTPGFWVRPDGLVVTPNGEVLNGIC
jgi:uncharacterized protein YdaU (DUF1376 family)